MRGPDDEQEARERAPGVAAEGPSEVPVRNLARESEERFRAIAERALQEQLEVERSISELSRRFLNVTPGDFRACMQEGLATIAALADADRSRFVVVSPDDMGLAGEYQWGAEAIRRRPQIADWKGEIAQFRWSAKRLVAGEVLHVPRLADLPPEAAAERASFDADGVTSYLGLPIRRDGRAVGFLDFARGPRPRAREGWVPDEISRLRLVAEVFGAAVQRLQLEQELARQLEVEKRVSDFARALLEHGAQEVDAGIERGLEAAAAFVGADRAYLIAGTTSGADPSVHDWCGRGIAPRPHRLGLADRRQQRWVSEQLGRGEVVLLARVEDAPPEAHVWRDCMLEDGVRSYLCIPIRVEGRLDAVLGFHWLQRRARCGDGDLAVLQLMAELFVGALGRKRAERRLEANQQQLSQAQKMEALGTLAGGIAHDFNNQLTVMLANARYAMRHLEEDSEVGRALADLHRAAQHCAQLTRGLLAFSRRTPASPRALDVSAVIEEVEDLLRPLVPSSIDFQIVDRHAGARIVVDPVQLQQVIVNLVVNARDAMPGGGALRLTVSTRALSSAQATTLGVAPGRYVELAVADTGVGIDAQVRSRIFEPFFTTKEQGQGTGLGLATCYGIVQECRGAIEVQSEPGQGATFRVLLPESRSLAEVGEAPELGVAPQGRGSVLVVEDEPAVRRALARALREGGYEVVEAGDGVEAMELAGARHFDALVTDVEMPRVGGVDLARRLVAERSPLPVLFVSGTAVEALQAPRAPVPRCRFLAKPFSDAALLDAVHGLLVERRSSATQR
jgi:signal transduction histidine kinase/ActR/RegA family two-component response regulator